MSESSSTSSWKKPDVLLTVEDIPRNDVSRLPLIGCTKCNDHLQVDLRESKKDNGAYYFICPRYQVTVEGKTCYFYKWLHQYVELLHDTEAPSYLLRRIKELHRQKEEIKAKARQATMSAHSTGSITSRCSSLKGERPPINTSQLEELLYAAPRDPEKCCPRCGEKTDCRISWTKDHFAMRFYRCNGKCNFLQWIDGQHEEYVKLLLKSLCDASLETKKECNNLSTKLEEKTTLLKYAEDLRYTEQLQNSATFRNLDEQLENKTRRILELEEQLENKARRIQQLEKPRGNCFRVFLWLISVSFAMFIGAALEYGKGN